AAKRAGWLPQGDNYPKASHVGFGLVLGEDGKCFRTRNTEVVRLVDLLDEAKNRSKAALIEHGKGEEWTKEEIESTADAVGYGAVKYADLKNNRLTNYTLNFDQMLNDKIQIFGMFVNAYSDRVFEGLGSYVPLLNLQLKMHMFFWLTGLKGFHNTSIEISICG
ncbi:hypothetical protein Gotur_022174, partial [Gossypium turneri]